jgi:hypothetical protein
MAQAAPPALDLRQGRVPVASGKVHAIYFRPRAWKTKHSAVSTQRQRSAISSQQSAFSNQQSAFSNQHSAISIQQSAFSKAKHLKRRGTG